ncbi:MAG: GbsR/MarR family transcriptional regulator, partial [Candidatus Hodarchaeota archaeon]
TGNELDSSEKILKRFKSNIVQLFEEIWALRGNNPIAGRLYAIILLSTTPLTQRELEEASGYSRGQISKTLKDLESALFVEKSRQVGSREKLYGLGSSSFLETFADRMKIATKVLRQKMEMLENDEKEWNELPTEVQRSTEARRILEVRETFYNYYDFYLSSMDDVIKKIEEKIRQLNNDLRK